MGKMQQAKGKRGELELAELLEKTTGYEIQRGGSLSFGSVPDLYGLPDIHIECKRAERLNIHDAMKQAQRDATAFCDGAPCVFWRRNREQWTVTMNVTDWLELYKGNIGMKSDKPKF